LIVRLTCRSPQAGRRRLPFCWSRVWWSSDRGRAGFWLGSWRILRDARRLYRAAGRAVNQRPPERRSALLDGPRSPGQDTAIRL